MIVNKKSFIRTTRRRDSECPINLAQWRAWFADGDGQQGEGAAGGQSGTNGKTPIESLPPDVQDYIKELRGEAKSAREERQKLNQQIETLSNAQRKQLEEQGNFKAISEQQAIDLAQLKPAKERLEEIEKGMRATNAERIATIPDNKKPLVQPLIDVLSPEKLQAYLNANPSLFVKEPAANYDAGAGAGSGGTPQVKLSSEELEMAKRFGVKPEEFLKIKARKTQEK